MSTLPEPSFIERDLDKIIRENVTLYEELTGKVLQPAQPERIYVNVIAYREYLLRIEIQNAALQNLVNYAAGDALDHLGIRLGVTRLEAQAARTTLRFTLVSAQTVGIAVPAGTQVRSKDGKYTFATDVSASIPAGSLYADISAVCQVSGIGANGYIAGDISTMLGTLAYVQSASNITVSSGGSDIETDEHLRDRIIAAPESFSVAGPSGAYRFFAKSAHPDIIDVGVMTDELSAVVRVYPLTTSGAPSSEILDLVALSLDDETVRPLTDKVEVNAPTGVAFSVSAVVTVYTDADTATVESLVNTAIDTYVAELKSALGKDIVAGQLTGRITSIYGVYDVALTLRDAADEVFTVKVLDRSQYASMSSKTVTMAGYENG